VGVHVAGLIALGAFHFSRRPEAAAVPADISVHTIERVLEQPAPKPKPKIEPPPAPTVKAVIPDVVPPAPAPPPPALPAPAEPAARPVNSPLFFGSTTVATRVCYVVDGSGSMFGLMYLVRQQLRESILALSAEQSFNVVFFMRDGQILQAFNGRLEPAAPAAKAEALNLIARIRPEGQTAAERAFETALSQRDRAGRAPELVYFLTDGFDLMEGDGDVFVRRIQALRKSLAPAAVVHTIGICPDPHDRDILSRLAKACGGRCIQVD
jgi:hypothetical protein